MFEDPEPPERMPSPYRILLANFDQTDVAALEGLLSGIECELIATADNAETLNLCARFHPQLVLINSTMSEASGSGTCRHIKRDSATHNTMILVVAQIHQLSEIERAVEAGIDDFLSMPVSKAELVQRVENLLRRSRSGW